MATGGGYGNRNHGGAAATTRTNNNDDNRHTRQGADNQQRATDPDQLTLYMVDEFKTIVQNKTRQGSRISEPVIELEIANIKRKKDPSQYDKSEWKRHLPRNVQNCPDTILLVSMAYGNTPNEVESVLEAKMSQINLNEIPTDTSFQSITRPLKNLKRELDDNPLSNLFHAVRNIDDDEIERADRLFFSEALHLVPGLKEYTFEDAHNAVQAIRATNSEINNANELLPLLKVCRTDADIRQFLENLPKRPGMRSEPSVMASRIVDNEHQARSYRPDDRQNRDHNNRSSTLSIPPTTDRNPDFSQSSGSSRSETTRK